MSEINGVVNELKQGKIIIYPTDTILGIGCDCRNIDAINKIISIKKRANDKSFIILVDSIKMLQDIVDVPELAWNLMEFNKKPLTIIYDNPRRLPKELVAYDNSIAIRLTNDLLCKRLIGKLRNPLVSTSVNISGEKAANTLQDINPDILNMVDIVMEECNNFIPKFSSSTIIKLSSDNQIKIIRQ